MSLEIIQTYSFLKSCRYAFSLLSIPRCLLTVPDQGLENRVVYQTILSESRYLCDSVEFPGQNLTALDFRIPGTKKIKVPTMRDFNEINTTFYYPSNIPLFEFFSEWIARASYTNTQNAYYNDIVSQARIIQFQDGPKVVPDPNAAISPGLRSEQESIQFKLMLKNVYPLNISSLSSNWSDDGFHKISVSFFVEDIDIIDSDAKWARSASSYTPDSVAPGEIAIKPPDVENIDIKMPTIKF